MFLCEYFENIIKHQITLNILLPLLEEHSLITLREPSQNANQSSENVPS